MFLCDVTIYCLPHQKRNRNFALHYTKNGCPFLKDFAHERALSLLPAELKLSAVCSNPAYILDASALTA